MRGLSLGIGLGICHGGSSTPTPSVGNLVTYTNYADLLTKWAAMVPGDVLSPHASYTPTTAQVFWANRSIAGAGGTVIFPSNQTIQLRGQDQANINVEFVRGVASGSAVGDGGNFYSVYFKNCSKFAVHGFKVGMGEFGIMLDNCTDYDVSNNVAYDAYDDLVRIQNGTTRGRLSNNRLLDAITGAKLYYYTDGTTPVFYNSPGSGTLVDTNHNDGIQIYNGTNTDLEISSNVISGWLQGLWAVDELNIYSRLKVSGNDITASLSQALALGSYIANAEVSSNIVRDPSNKYPSYAAANIILNDNNNTGPYKTDGLNSFPAGYTTSPAINPAINLTNGVASGTATAPTAPGFTGTTSNVGNLATLRLQPAYTAYSGAPSVPSGFTPTIYGPGGALSSYVANAKLTVNPPPVRGRTANCEDAYQTRWKSSPGGSIVQAAGTGRTYMKYTAPSTGGSFYAEVDVGDGVWVASNVVAVASANSTFQTGLANVTYSNGNLTITKDAGADSDRNGVSSNILPTADGWYAWEMTPTLISGGGANIGFMDGGSNTLDYNGASWYYNGSNVRSGSPGTTFDGTQKCLILMQISSSGTVRKIWLYTGAANGWSAADGNPNSGGAGWDVSSVGLTWATTRAKARVTKAAEACTANFGQNAYGTTVPNTPAGV